MFCPKLLLTSEGLLGLPAWLACLATCAPGCFFAFLLCSLPGVLLVCLACCMPDGLSTCLPQPASREAEETLPPVDMVFGLALGSACSVRLLASPISHGGENRMSYLHAAVSAGIFGWPDA